LLNIQLQKPQAMKNHFFTFLFTIFIFNLSAQTTKILFIGNSLTSYQPVAFEEFAKQTGYEVKMEKSIWFGHPIEDHLEKQVTLDLINSDNWDYVVLQGSSYNIAFPEYHYLIEPTYRSFIDLIHTNNPNSKIIFFMDWTNADDIELYENIYTPNELHSLIHHGTMEFARKYDFIVSPIGEAFNFVLNNHSDINCLMQDKIHPNSHGSFLAACVYFYLVFGEIQNEYFTYIGDLNTEEANLLQDIAESIVLTDYDYWHLRVDTMTTKTNEFNFNNCQANIFPNPATNEININISESLTTDCIIHIYNSLGTKVLSKKGITSNLFTINTSALKEGLYICELRFNDQTIKNKILIYR
jgi:Secretion system C-terminal sorting domain/Domain of unknown function (DUF4886)